MCGVFGFVSLNDAPVNLKVLARIAQITERRGPHAFGFAWIDGKGRLCMYKQTGRVSDSLCLLAMAADASLLIGHCRYATQGDPANNLNNHPHPADGGWIVHNGMIHDYDTAVFRHDLYPVTDCDSEVLGLLIERAGGDALIDRCTEAVLGVKKAPLVVLGLWKPGRLVAVRQGNPLHTGLTAAGTYLASLPDGLPGRVREFPDEQAVEYGEEPSHASL
jgi:glucosamine 6-phosphate synthetase-like amidotransferase/phosphosugar isomerase protein